MENNWSIEQTKRLFDFANAAHENKRGLVWAFAKISEETGRSLNSVRNYYYSQLKMFALIPGLAEQIGVKVINTQRGTFELFTDEEIDSLLEQILKGKAQGVSVRATIAEMTGDNKKAALRYQNKYRSMVLNHKSKVTAVMSSLSQRGEPYYNPYTKQVITDGSSPDSYEKFVDYISSLDEKEVDSFFTLMKKLFA